MRTFLAAGAVAGAVLLGGLPALATALADDQARPPGRSAVADRPGPPPWVQLHGPGRDAAKARWKDARRTQLEAWKQRKREQQRAWRADADGHDGPPPWAGGPWRSGR
jgi:hypothetical protein